MYQYFIFTTMAAIGVIIEDVPESVVIQLKRLAYFQNTIFPKLEAGGSDVVERFRREAHRMAKSSAGVTNFERVFRMLGGTGDR